MRLSTEHIRLIRETAIGEFGPSVEVTLFGSRLDDLARGGDIDIMVTVPANVTRPALKAARLAALIERKLGGRRVDVVLVTPETLHQPIHDIARQHGIRI
jgi:predicted nucleotidyltransferase